MTLFLRIHFLSSSRMSKTIAYKPLFGWFLITCGLFLLSWLCLLRSTRLVDLPNSKLRQTLVKPHSRNDQSSRKCDPNILKVYMYDLPSQFHFELIGWKKNSGKGVWPDITSLVVPEYPGGLNSQHSIEYWLTLDLLLSSQHSGIMRVENADVADVLFVPFFSSVSYNRGPRSADVALQEELVRFLVGQEGWKRSGGKDHVIVAHHPNSLLEARTKLWPAMFILSDFGRYPPNVANVEKDVIAPYKHVVRGYAANDSSGFDDRPNLLYFRGAIYRKDGGSIRQELYYMLNNETGVVFSFGTFQKDGGRQASKGMQASKFCLNIAGDTPSSNRLFDAIASHCVPVIISDEIELPYEDVLDYSEFCVFVRTSDALKENFLLNLTRNIGKDEWNRKWNRLKEIEHFYEYRHPSQDNDAVQMIWQAIHRKVFGVKREIHKSRRFTRTSERDGP